MEVIKGTGLKKKYGVVEVLKGVDISIYRQELVTIVGPSGAGKSTLLQILGTLDKPDSGSLLFADTAPFTLSARSLAHFRNQQIGFIFQFHHLLPEFSALENVCIPGFIAGKGKKEVLEKAQGLLEKLNLGHRIQHKPTELSGGEQQRVAIARALINSPSVVFADEPTGNLDSKNAEELHDLFLQLKEELGQTFVIVTHNEALASLADRVLEMKDGVLAEQK